MNVAEARKFFVCRTRVSFDPGHGTQVSYMRPDGSVFLWYPGNAVVLRGGWEIAPRAASAGQVAEQANLCFRYGSNTYNPVTKRVGGQWNCLPAAIFARTTVDGIRGDVFRLAGRTRTPFELSRDKTTIADLKRFLDTRETVPNTVRDKECEDAPELNDSAGPLRNQRFCC